ncbi:transcriptional regulator [Christensenellaceae bacterium]|nr:transcriptional regulator [Christensenellaceae bacterium]BDF62046.1 transcriptional regulator [Christensenellaceae bacterium]
MMKQSMEELDKMSRIFKMLSDPSRLRIIFALHDTEMCVAHLCDALGLEQSAVSHQLQNLKTARLVKSRKEGKNVFYSLDDAHVLHIIDQVLEHIRH